MTHGNRPISFWLLGAVYWTVLVAIIIALFNLWPSLQNSTTFFYVFIVAGVVGGFVIVYLFRPKRGG